MGVFSRVARFLPKTYELKHFRNIETWRKGISKYKSYRGYVFLGLSAGCAALFWAFSEDTKKSGAFCDAVPTENNRLVQNTSLTLSKKSSEALSLEEAIKRSQDIMIRCKEVTGAPGIVVAVSVNGQTVWAQGFGYSDMENCVPCTPSTVMRIASISKSITMAVVAKLWENGKLDLDKPVQEYVPDFPQKKVDNVPVEISSRHLVSHLSGIRHYFKKGENADDLKDLGAKEFFFKDKFANMADSLKLFQDDELFHKPGEKYLYTTHGFTLLSAIVEKIQGEPFPNTMKKLFEQFGMTETYLDENDPIMYNRSRYYSKSKLGHIQNAPYVDNSYKWAGGGFVSTVGDLLKFGNIMLYSYQHDDNAPGPPGYLKKGTMRMLWTRVEKAEHYGMGWAVSEKGHVFGGAPVSPFFVRHSGGAIGASSSLFILPQQTEVHTETSGVIVAIITNLGGVTLYKQAKGIAHLFSNVCLPTMKD